MTIRNLILNPRLNPNKVTLINTQIKSSTWNATDNRWSINLVCKDTTLDPADPYAKLETDCSGLAGVAVVAAAQCAGINTSLYQARTLMLAAYDSSSNLLGSANYGQVPDVGPHLLTLEWTVPEKTSRLECRLYTTVNGSPNVWWSEPILCTKTDWQRLPGYGLTYFSGDTMPKIE